jgi:hypothetical protein
VRAQQLPVTFDDAGHVRLERRIECRRDPRRARRAGGVEHHLDEVRGHEPRLDSRERQPLIERLANLRRGECAVGLHPPKHRSLTPHGCLAATVGIEVGRALRQPRQKRRLCRRDCASGNAEVPAAGALDAHELIAVGRDVQIEREDFALREAVLQAQGDDRLAKLGDQTALPPRRRSIQELLGHLLRDRRSSFGDTALEDVGFEGPHDGNGIETDVIPEASILGRDRGRHEDRRQRVGSQLQAARLIARERFAQRRAVPIDHERRRVCRAVEQPRRQRPHAQPQCRERERGDRHECRAGPCQPSPC